MKYKTRQFNLKYFQGHWYYFQDRPCKSAVQCNRTHCTLLDARSILYYKNARMYKKYLKTKIRLSIVLLLFFQSETDVKRTVNYYFLITRHQ